MIHVFKMVLASGVVAAMTTAGALAAEISLPADCTLGENCFFQQFPDMAPGPAAVDPFCGSATYDGHKGVDLRVLSMVDIRRAVPVVAVADGKVLRIRDGVVDRLAITPEEQKAVAAEECGNGIVIQHADGLETQYCHLRRGSVAVAPGDMVKRGDVIGAVGASGMAQFPHVHLSVRRNGEAIDPITGRPLTAGCLKDMAAADPLFSPEVIGEIKNDGASLLAFGLAGEVLKHNTLVTQGPPATARSDSSLWIAWAWFINLHQGDQINYRVQGPDGNILLQQTSKAIDHSKATYSAYFGKSKSPAPGDYEVTVGLIRDGAAIIEKSKTVTVN